MLVEVVPAPAPSWRLLANTSTTSSGGSLWLFLEPGALVWAPGGGSWSIGIHPAGTVFTSPDGASDDGYNKRN